MQFFDGNAYSNRRQVSLRGASRRLETSATLLNRIREQRAQRSRKRREHASATRLQSAVRSYLEREALLNALRQTYDEISFVDQSVLPLLLFITSRGRIQQISMEEDTNVRFQIDVERTVKAVQAIWDTPLSLPSIHLAGLFALYLHSASVCLDRVEGMQETVFALISAAQTTLASIEAEGEERVRDVLRHMLDSYFLFEKLGELAKCPETCQIAVALSTKLLRLSVKFCITDERDNLARRMHELYGRWILTVEGVGSTTGLTLHETTRLCEWHMEARNWRALSTDLIEAFLGNILILTRNIWDGKLSRELWVAVRIVTGLLSAIPEFTDEMAASCKEEDRDESEDENMKDAKVQSVLDKISPLLKESHIENLLRSSAVEAGGESMDSLARLIMIYPTDKQNLQNSVLNALAFTPPSVPSILPIMWRKCVLRFSECTGSDSMVGDDCLDQRSGNTLLLFARAFARKLYLQDESEKIIPDEADGQGTYFSESELKSMCRILKDALCAAFCRISRGHAQSAVKNAKVLRSQPGLLDAVARLLSRLYFIDENHRFTLGSNFWPSRHPALASPEFIRDAVPVLSKDIQRPHMQQSQIVVADILSKAPYLVPFGTRASIFYALIDEERKKVASRGRDLRPRHWVTIRRNFLFEDALEQLWNRGEGLKAPIRVKFVDSLGTEEVGIDGGGVYKEFMTLLLKKSFSPSGYGLFATTENNELYPDSRQVVADPEGYERTYRFIGQMLGKAVFDGVLVDLPFANFFLKKMLKKGLCFGDLKSLDAELYRNLSMLKSLSAEEIENLALDFTITDHKFGHVQEVPLVQDGKSIPVTKKNVIRYINLVAFHRMYTSIKKILEQFLVGFREIVKLRWIQLFSERELQLLISGKKGSIDIKDLRACTIYSGGYSEDSPVIKWFWSVVESLDDERKKKLLRFVTSSECAPLLGFSYLHPKFCVHRASGHEDGDHRLPTASTCVNLLKLPPYNSAELLREKILYVLDSNAGFDLS